MTTPNAFLKALSGITGRHIWTSKITIALNVQDAAAGKLLFWLGEELMPEATMGELDTVLDAAKLAVILPDRVLVAGTPAGELLNWLTAQMPGATPDDLNDVLDAAKWWHTLFGAMDAAAPADA